MEKAKEKIFKSEKFSGIIPYGKYHWKDLFKIGFDLTTAGTEITILRDATKTIIKEFKSHKSNI
jgi:2-keto-3-deoxy-L-rhamnonate aldolase RhmA